MSAFKIQENFLVQESIFIGNSWRYEIDKILPSGNQPCLQGSRVGDVCRLPGFADYCDTWDDGVSGCLTSEYLCSVYNLSGKCI